jgi:hypothetical protein
MIRVVFDPFKLVIEVAHDLYPGIQAKVFFSAQANKKEYGSTSFGDPVPVILISAHTPLFVAPEILAHEIAHVVAGIKVKHGKKWEKAFAAIHREYVKRITKLAPKLGLKALKYGQKGF